MLRDRRLMDAARESPIVAAVFGIHSDDYAAAIEAVTLLVQENKQLRANLTQYISERPQPIVMLLDAADKALGIHEDAPCSCRGCAALRAAIAKAGGR